MKQISIDNGRTYMDAEQALSEMAEYTDNALETMLPYMEDDAREQANEEVAPCTDLEFLESYLSFAENDLVIG